MQNFAVSPNFTGFVRFHNSTTDKFTNPVNTSQILGFSSSVCREQDAYSNSVSYIDEDNKLQTICCFHKSIKEENDELPLGRDFENAFAKVCNEADKTGDILNILI